MARDVSQLHPKLQRLADQLVEKAASKGLKVKITDCVRNKAEQDDCNRRGTSSVKYPNSHHCWGTAFDFCRNDGTGAYNDSDGWFGKVGKIGQSLGLEWGGAWKSPVDKPHFQLPDWGTGTAKLKSTYGTPDAFRKTWQKTSNSSSKPSGSTPVKPQNDPFPLSKGDRGENVEWTQKMLAAAGYKLTADGIFGTKTEDAVRKYQKNKGLTVDGIVGTKTKAALESKTSSKKPTSSYTVGKTYTLLSNMNVRTGPGTGYRKKKRSELTADGKKNAKLGFYAVLKKGTRVTIKEVRIVNNQEWVRIPSGWNCAKDSKKTYLA